MSLALAGAAALKGRLGRAYLGARGYGEGCLAILGFEGGRGGGRAPARARARARCAAAAGCRSGARPGEAWLRGRFAAPYLRDELLTHGVMVETLETATQWSNLQRAARRGRRARSRGALQRSGTPGLVMCHVSHLYETGASLYFTFLAAPARGRGDRAVARGQGGRQRRDRRRAAARSPTTTRSGATTRRGWRARSATTGVAALRALKAELDPAGIMNPGKLLPTADRARRLDQCSANAPRRTTGPGSSGVGSVSRVSSIVWYLPALVGSSAPPCRLPLAPTAGAAAERLVAGRRVVEPDGVEEALALGRRQVFGREVEGVLAAFGEDSATPTALLEGSGERERDALVFFGLARSACSSRRSSRSRSVRCRRRCRAAALLERAAAASAISTTTTTIAATIARQQQRAAERASAGRERRGARRAAAPARGRLRLGGRSARRRTAARRAALGAVGDLRQRRAGQRRELARRARRPTRAPAREPSR